MLPELPHSDPTPLYRFRDGLYATDLLTTALVELDLFTHLDAHPSDLATICQSLGIAERPTDVALTLFVAMGLLWRDDAIVRLTDVARDHLVRDSPFFLGPYYASFKDRPVVRDFAEVLRTGRPSNWASAPGRQDWATRDARADIRRAVHRRHGLPRSLPRSRRGRRARSRTAARPYSTSPAALASTPAVSSSDIHISRPWFSSGRPSMKWPHARSRNAASRIAWACTAPTC